MNNIHTILHFYIFYKTGNYTIYKRTCGTKKSAEDRVIQLKKHYDDAFYFENDIPKNFKYFC